MATLYDRPDLFSQAVLGVTPHPLQAEWMRCQERVKVAVCGRRWGKTYSQAAETIWFGVTRHNTTQFLVAPTHDQASVMFAYIEQMLMGSPDLRQIVRRVVRSPFPTIEWENGSRFTSRSAGDDGAHLRGHGADVVRLDECAFIPRAVVEEVVPPMLAQSQYGLLSAISTPFGMNHFHELYAKGHDGVPGYASFRFPTSSNPYISDAYLRQQRISMTEMAFAVEYEATFHEDQATVFKHELIQSCIADRADGPLPAHRYVIGYDPAKWVDRSAVVVLDVTTEPWQVVEVRDIAGRDYTLQAPIIRELAQTYNRARVLLDVGLANDQMLEALVRDGVQAEGFQFTNPSKQDLINGLVIAMEQGRVRFYSHADLLKELSYYRFELTAAGNVKLGAPDKPGHHDDLVTALALAVRLANDGLGLPYGYVHRSPYLTAPLTDDEAGLSDEERTRRRVAAFYASQTG